jgi:sporulation protein YlmC with PRC-barrel domain
VTVRDGTTPGPRLAVGVSWPGVDEGNPIAYQVLERGVPVLASDGKSVGTVDHVVMAPEKDIFHGLVIKLPDRGKRFVLAEDVASLHEHGVDLRIDPAAVHDLPEPGGGAGVYDEDPGEMKGWHHWVHRATLRGDWQRER